MKIRFEEIRTLKGDDNKTSFKTTRPSIENTGDETWRIDSTTLAQQMDIVLLVYLRFVFSL